MHTCLGSIVGPSSIKLPSFKLMSPARKSRVPQIAPAAMAGRLSTKLKACSTNHSDEVVGAFASNYTTAHAPAMTSEAPDTNLVRLCTTTSAPWIAGESITGENVLSTTSLMP